MEKTATFEIENPPFKIIKKRNPWSKEEDNYVLYLVSKYGIGNWSLISNEINNKFKTPIRSGKQCRERYHNHLDPKIKKNYWNIEEENILLKKQYELGNKWSEISKFLPGRTDNSIKNHFYSKFRKFIRKIMKQIIKEKIFSGIDIDFNKYNADKIYFLLKKYKISYDNVNKENIINLIFKNEKKNNYINNLNINNNNEKNGFYSSLSNKISKRLKQKKNKMNLMKKKLTIKIYNEKNNNKNNLNSPSVETSSGTPFASKFLNRENKLIDLTNKIIIYDNECNNNNNFSYIKEDFSLTENQVKENIIINSKNIFSSLWNPIV